MHHCQMLLCKEHQRWHVFSNRLHRGQKRLITILHRLQGFAQLHSALCKSYKGMVLCHRRRWKASISYKCHLCSSVYRPITRRLARPRDTKGVAHTSIRGLHLPLISKNFKLSDSLITLARSSKDGNKWRQSSHQGQM